MGASVAVVERIKQMWQHDNGKGSAESIVTVIAVVAVILIIIWRLWVVF
jgi:hypothetical protein